MNRQLLVWAIAALIFHSPSSARAELATLTIGHLSVEAGGRHRVWVSVLDDAGKPILGQGAGQFSVEEDGISVRRIALIPYVSRYASVLVTVVVDPRLDLGLSGGALDSLVQALSNHLGSRDRLRIVTSGARFPSLDIPTNTSGALRSERLRGMGADVAPRTLDAAALEIERPMRARQGHFVLMVTGGPQGVNQSSMLQVMSLLRVRDCPATISLIEVGDSLAASERNRLKRLVVRSGGGVKSVSSTRELVATAGAFLDRARGAYLLDYRFGDWEPAANRHTIRIKFRKRTSEFSREFEFSAGDYVLAPWWGVPQPWIAAGLLVLLAVVTAAWASRPKPLCRLRVESGEERGYSYEVLGAPIRIGAIEGNDLVLEEPLISRSHAVLQRRKKGFEILDMNSENGTYVNGARVMRHVLSDGDEIGIGVIKFRFSGPR